MPDFSQQLSGAPVWGRRVSFTFWLHGAPVVELDPPNPLAGYVLLAVPPDWQRALELRLELPVPVTAGLTARETRAPRAETLRAELLYDAVLGGRAWNTLRDQLQHLADQAVILPAWPLAVPGAAFNPAVHCSGGILCGWKEDGSGLTALPAEQFEASAHDWVAPGLMGTLEIERASLIGADATRLRLRLIEDSPAEYALRPPALHWDTGPALNDTTTPRLFPLALEFGRRLEPELPEVEITRRTYGPGRRRALEYYPQWPRRGLAAEVVLSSPVELARLIAWWQAAAGPAEPHYVPWPPQVTHLAADAASGDTQLTLADPEALGEFRWLALLRPERTEIVRVLSLSGPTATLHAPLAQAWPAAWTVVALALLARHRDTELRLRCEAPGLARAALAWTEVPEEYQPASVETRQVTLGRAPVTAWLYTFTRDAFGQQQAERFTSYERDLTVAGMDYRAHPIAHTEFRASLEMQSDEITLRARRLECFEAFLPGRLTHRLYLEIAECTVTGGGQGANAQPRWRGEVVRVEFEGPFAQVTCRGQWALLDRPVPRLLIQPQCNHTVFDARCGLNRLDWTFSATWVSASGATVTAVNWSRAGGLPAGFGAAHYFALGYLERPSGERLPILDSTELASGQITLTLDRAPASAWSSAEPLQVVPGCDGRRETCQAWHATNNPEGKFDNWARFGGFPWVPAKNPAFTPPKRTNLPQGKK
jgi:hypothetical protein